MKIADLFVKLGFKGGDKAKKQIAGIGEAMDGVKDSSLLAKAAVVGVIYGMQRLMSHSAKMGTDILNFAQATGISTKALQQWRYAGMQFGATAGEVDGAIGGVQAKLTEMMKGGSVPQWLNMLSGEVNFDWFKGQKDPLYAMAKMQEMAQWLKANGNAGMTRDFARSFGLSDNVLAAMFEGGFNKRVFDEAPTLTRKETVQLREVDAQWKNFFLKFDLAIGKLNAAFGPDTMRVLTHLTTAMLGLTEAYLGTMGNTADWIDAIKMSPEERKAKGIRIPTWESFLGIDEGSKIEAGMLRRQREEKIRGYNNNGRSIFDLFRSTPAPSGAKDKGAAIFNMNFKVGSEAQATEVAYTVKKAVNDAYGEIYGKGLGV